MKTWLAVSLTAAAFAAAAVSPRPVPAGEGRYKKMPNGDCVWDGRDNGPDQCRPAGGKPKGRYKLDGHKKCYWEPNDSGPNQCEPPK